MQLSFVRYFVYLSDRSTYRQLRNMCMYACLCLCECWFDGSSTFATKVIVSIPIRLLDIGGVLFCCCSFFAYQSVNVATSFSCFSHLTGGLLLLQYS